MHLRLKLTSEMCQKLESLDEKTEENRLKLPIWPPVFQNTTAFIEKQKNTNRFSIVKISATTNLYFDDKKCLWKYVRK